MNIPRLLHLEPHGLSLFSVACISGLTLSFHPFLCSHICTSRQLTPLTSFIRPICFFYLQEHWIFSINTTYAHYRLKIMFVLHYAEIEDKVASFFLKVLLKYKGVILHRGFRAQFFLNCFLLDNNRSFGEKCQKMSVVGLRGSSEQSIHMCGDAHTYPYTCGGWRFGAAFLSSSSSCEGDFHMTCQLIMFLLQAIQRNTITAYTEQVTNTQVHGEWEIAEHPAAEDLDAWTTLSSNVIHSFRNAVAQKNKRNRVCLEQWEKRSHKVILALMKTLVARTHIKKLKKLFCDLKQ